jgi:hypothetical protein
MDEPTENLPAKVTIPDRAALVALAREMAMAIHAPEEILERHGITADQYAVIVNNPFYSRVLDAETVAWQSAANTPERIKVEAAAMLELFLPELYARMVDREGSTLTAVVEGGKFVAKIAGIGEREAGGGSGQQFTISINLGEATVKKETGPVIDVAPNADS